MLKKIWFQIHWLLGITAGLVLAIVGVTGAMLSFQDELLLWLNPHVMRVQSGGESPLPPAELLARIEADQPDKRITSLTLFTDPQSAARVVLATRSGGKAGQNNTVRRNETHYSNPYTGKMLGQPRGAGFFRATMEIHRWLAADDVGKQIVGASTIGLIVLALSGLYLRWPRRMLNWRTWFTFHWTRKGRGFLWDLHSVVGTWVLLPYLLMGLTGLYWSYDWYRDGLFALTGAPRPNQQNAAGAGKGKEQKAAQQQAPDITAAWSAFRQEVDEFSSVTLRLPERAGQAVQINYLSPNPSHDRASNRLTVNATTGEITQHERYNEKPLGAKLMSSMFALHSGSFFGLPGMVALMLASLAMPLFAITGWMLYLDSRKKKQAARKAQVTNPPRIVDVGAAVDELLIGFASQTGFAERLAWQTASSLQAVGMPVTVQPLNRLTQDHFKQFRRALFVVSTFGDGEPPDSARSFVRKLMKQHTQLDGLRFGLLVLGDRQYNTFCGFGKALDHWLRGQGAQPLFEPIEVDNGDAGSIANWRRHLGSLSGASNAQSWTEPEYGRWRLSARRLLNPRSQGGPTFHLELEPIYPLPVDWKSGDLVEVVPRHSRTRVAQFLNDTGLDGRILVQHADRAQPLAEVLARSVLSSPGIKLETNSIQNFVDELTTLPHREYSISSLPEDDAVHLLIRQVRLNDGFGLGSGWLTEHAAIGAEIELRIRTNNSFHLPDDDRPLILIGNGTGLASLRSHLKARARAAHRRNWLIFGERNAACDFYYREEIESWQTQGLLTQVDMAFSRDQAERGYVQDRVRQAKNEVRNWISEGAAIYVCGSVDGMAPGVDETLVDILGKEEVERLVDEGRYRRDVY
jgi:sulfite reductase (NADPH) flavoprotein alpha-component